MRIKILGAHMFESNRTRLSSILIDDILAVDAGSLTSGLSFTEQERVESILLTHGHYDHIRDIPAIALKSQHRTISIYATQSTLDILTSHLINGTVYPKFTDSPNPVLKLHNLEPHQGITIGEYSVLAVPVSHAIPSVGYQITDGSGKSIFFSGDTGPGLATCWERITPQMIIMDMSFSNKSANVAPKPGHLCPSLLGDELRDFERIKGYLPRVVMTHMNPEVEEEIRIEARQLAQEMGIEINLAHEGMEIEI